MRQKVAKRPASVVDLLSWSLLVWDVMDVWSGEVDADNGGGVVWCSDFSLAAVEESVGGGVFMLLLVSEEEHRRTDRLAYGQEMSREITM